MQVSVTRVLQKIKNEIVETFSITPEHQFLKDSKKEVFFIIQKIIGKMSLKGYKILDVQEFDYKIIKRYEFDDFDTPKMLWTISFEYKPFLGEKKCIKCLNYYEGYCLTRGLKLKYDMWNNCMFYKENSLINVKKN